MKKTLKDWEIHATNEQRYHDSQWNKIYRSTVFFYNWLVQIGILRKNIRYLLLDVCCGEGANTRYVAQRFPLIKIRGIDFNNQLIKKASERIKKLGIKNCSFGRDDLFKLKYLRYKHYNGIVMLQTLSWLPEYKTPLTIIAKLRPNWIALSSLFFEGNIETDITLRDYNKHSVNNKYRKLYYNIYSIPIIKEYFRKLGYPNFYYKKFDIDIDLTSSPYQMGTYTELLHNKKRIQISGPILMNWYFICATKD